MRKNLVLLLLGALVGGLVMTVLPVGAHHQPGMRQLHRDVNRLERKLTNRTQHLNRNGVYRGRLAAYQVISECPDQANAVWRLQAERARSLSGLDECRQQRRRDLLRHTFESVGVTEDGQPRSLVAGTRIVLGFEERRRTDVIRWVAGCNFHGAAVEITSDRLLLGEISGTAMGCRDERHEQDDWLRGFMSSDPFWNFERRVVAGDRLTLTSEDTVIEFVARD